jgi:hypothetical protein
VIAPGTLPMSAVATFGCWRGTPWSKRTSIKSSLGAPRATVPRGYPDVGRARLSAWPFRMQERLTASASLASSASSGLFVE